MSVLSIFSPSFIPMMSFSSGVFKPRKKKVFQTVLIKILVCVVLLISLARFPERRKIFRRIAKYQPAFIFQKHNEH